MEEACQHLNQWRRLSSDGGSPFITDAGGLRLMEGRPFTIGGGGFRGPSI